MLTAERRQIILERLQREGRVISLELSADLDVSEDTIRRDLREMAAEGLLQRVHGGALPRSPAATSYRLRQDQAPAAKQAIAHAAAGLIQPGQVVLLDGGTTNVLLAQALTPDLRATIITNSPPVAVALAEHPGAEVYLLGGRLFKDSVVAVGAATVEELRTIRADWYMLGVCSLHAEVGISTTDFEEARVKRAMIASAAEVVALASAEKLNTAASFVVAPLNELTHLVTEQAAPDAVLSVYERLGITIMRV